MTEISGSLLGLAIPLTTEQRHQRPHTHTHTMRTQRSCLFRLYTVYLLQISSTLRNEHPFAGPAGKKILLPAVVHVVVVVRTVLHLLWSPRALQQCHIPCCFPGRLLLSMTNSASAYNKSYAMIYGARHELLCLW